MPFYRRVRRRGGTHFLTLVTENRSPIFARYEPRTLLRSAIDRCRASHRFDLRAAVLLPDHLHLLITLPPGDDDFPTRITNLKAYFTRAYLAAGGAEQARSASRVRQRSRGVWLKRSWEHTVRDDEDPSNHYDHICYNPVKHGLTTCPHLWAHYSFARLVSERRYAADWSCRCGRPDTPPWPEPSAFDVNARAAGE